MHHFETLVVYVFACGSVLIVLLAVLSTLLPERKSKKPPANSTNENDNYQLPDVETLEYMHSFRNKK